jgi:hypothetical protein
MDEQLQADIEALASSLDDPDEAALLLALFAIASRTDYVPPTDDGYTPFVYPH